MEDTRNLEAKSRLALSLLGLDNDENKYGWSQVLTAVSTGGLGRSSKNPELLVILQKRVTGTWTCRSGGLDKRILRVSRTRASKPEGHTLHLGRGARLCLLGHSACGHSATFWPEVTLACDFPWA